MAEDKTGGEFKTEELRESTAFRYERKAKVELVEGLIKSGAVTIDGAKAILSTTPYTKIGENIFVQSNSFSSKKITITGPESTSYRITVPVGEWSRVKITDLKYSIVRVSVLFDQALRENENPYVTDANLLQGPLPGGPPEEWNALLEVPKKELILDFVPDLNFARDTGQVDTFNLMEEVKKL